MKDHNRDLCYIDLKFTKILSNGSKNDAIHIKNTFIRILYDKMFNNIFFKYSIHIENFR